MKLNVWAFGLAFGVLGGIGFFVLTWWLIAFGGAADAAEATSAFARIYIGYQINALGSVIGLIWGFVHGFIWGVIFAWLYNMFAARMGGEAEA